MPAGRTRTRRTPMLLVAALIGGLSGIAAAGACSTPSAEIDGGDLLGVFAHDASTDGALDAGPQANAAKKVAAPPPVPGLDASVRTPIEGVCVTEEGAPNREVRRVLGRPACRGSQVLEWKDEDGAPRYACAFSPPGVETRAPLPLIVFFPDSEDDPTAIDKKTGLRKLGASFSLSGDPSHQGFVILAVQGRHIQRGKHGSIFETEYTGPGNVDVAAVDHFVAEIAAKGLVDTRRVYTLGASYGGQMAATYAMMRPDRVAAFGAYAADAPRAAWSCAGPPPPGIVVYRACDGYFSCESVERWLRARDSARAETAWLRLGAQGEDEPSCAVKNKCTHLRSEGNHHRWPKTRETDVLKFFARHALGASAPLPTKDEASTP